MLVTDNTQNTFNVQSVPVARTSTMKAITQSAYGSADVLNLEVVNQPEVGDNEVLVRVHSAAVCKGDTHLLTGKPYLIRLMTGLRRPKSRQFGQNLAGTVESVGKKVTSVKKGDEVFGQVGIAGGAFAEYVSAPAATLAPKPNNLSFEQAAAIPDSALTALQGLRDIGQLRQGQHVLINGASGGVGTYAVQIAKAFGARVTAVCSTRHVDTVREIGADEIIDYTQEDFANNGSHYDLMFDLVGNRSLADIKRILKPNGVFVASAGAPGKNWIGPIVWMLKVALMGAVSSQKMSSFIVKPCFDDLLVLKELAEKGQLKSVIERRYPLQNAAEAVQHVAEGHAQGKTVINVEHSDS